MPKLPTDPRFIDLTGKKFSRWTVVKYDGKRGPAHYWKCKCRCGNVKSVYGGNLVNGKSQSCDCLRIEATIKAKTTHGCAPKRGVTKEYSIWAGMISRCENPKVKKFDIYGGRGIKVCKRWRNSFPNFLADMGKRPKGLTIDRFPDKDGDYRPGNCRWANWFQQARNRNKPR